MAALEINGILNIPFHWTLSSLNTLTDFYGLYVEMSIVLW